MSNRVNHFRVYGIARVFVGEGSSWMRLETIGETLKSHHLPDGCSPDLAFSVPTVRLKVSDLVIDGIAMRKVDRKESCPDLGECGDLSASVISLADVPSFAEIGLSNAPHS